MATPSDTNHLSEPMDGSAVNRSVMPTAVELGEAVRSRVEHEYRGAKQWEAYWGDKGNDSEASEYGARAWAYLMVLRILADLTADAATSTQEGTSPTS